MGIKRGGGGGGGGGGGFESDQKTYSLVISISMCSAELNTVNGVSVVKNRNCAKTMYN